MTYDVYEHYKVEKELAKRLMNSTREERQVLYSELYDEMFTRISEHPMLLSKKAPLEKQKEINTQLSMISQFLNKDTTYVEIGPGDCSFAFAVAENVKKAYGIDVSEILTDNKATPENFELVISDGTSVPLADGSVDFVYSNQLMEHLHPQDAIIQLTNIYNTLKTGSVYFCQTPNKLNGPHDVSRQFDDEASCFHLKEYTIRELNSLFKKAGFSKVRCIIGAKGILFTIPTAPIIAIETILDFLPKKIRLPLARTKLIDSLINIRILGYR